MKLLCTHYFIFFGHSFNSPLCNKYDGQHLLSYLYSSKFSLYMKWPIVWETCWWGKANPWAIFYWIIDKRASRCIKKSYTPSIQSYVSLSLKKWTMKTKDDLEDMSEKWYKGIKLQIEMIETRNNWRIIIYVKDYWN